MHEGITILTTFGSILMIKGPWLDHELVRIVTTMTAGRFDSSWSKNPKQTVGCTTSVHHDNTFHTHPLKDTRGSLN